MIPVCYDTGHVNCTPVIQAFAKGCGADIVPMDRAREPDPRPAVWYGMMRGGIKLYGRCLATERQFWYIDNGYFGRRGLQWGYYRIARDNWIMPAVSEPDYDRLALHGVKDRPWKKTGYKVLVCPPIPEYSRAWKFNGRAWLNGVLAGLRQVTDRKIVVAYKPSDPRCPPKKPPLSAMIEKAWAVVTHDSNVAVDSIIAGVPVFVTGHHPARDMGLGDIAKIETPIYPDNWIDWLATLASSQWTLDEFKAGVPHRTLEIA